MRLFLNLMLVLLASASAVASNLTEENLVGKYLMAGTMTATKFFIPLKSVEGKLNVVIWREKDGSHKVSFQLFRTPEELIAKNGPAKTYSGNFGLIAKGSSNTLVTKDATCPEAGPEKYSFELDLGNATLQDFERADGTDINMVTDMMSTVTVKLVGKMKKVTE
jgi:hypothetical protein